LEAANLVTTLWRGREKLHYLNAAPINEIAERWINRYEQERVSALADLKRALEGDVTPRPTFVYTTYIRTTPEQLWQALTEPAFTSRYWSLTIASDWKVGAQMTWTRRGIITADPAQVVLEYDPYRRMSYTWPDSIPDAESSADDQSASNTDADERRSQVTFELEPMGQMVKLTVIHDNLDPGSKLFARISQGWPGVLANLKTLLETGETMYGD
jgi:uncharacterized protein YndB with AHSA1/START domain